MLGVDAMHTIRQPRQQLVADRPSAIGEIIDAVVVSLRNGTGNQPALTDLDAALEQVLRAKEKGEALSVGLLGNIAEVMPELARRGIVPDVITDQTSAHDLRFGYIPAGYSLEEADRLRGSDPEKYDNEVLDSMVTHVQAILDLKAKGAVCFDYGNNLRGQVADHRGMLAALRDHANR